MSSNTEQQVARHERFLSILEEVGFPPASAFICEKEADEALLPKWTELWTRTRTELRELVRPPAPELQRLFIEHLTSKGWRVTSHDSGLTIHTEDVTDVTKLVERSLTSTQAFDQLSSEERAELVKIVSQSITLVPVEEQSD